MFKMSFFFLAHPVYFFLLLLEFCQFRLDLIFFLFNNYIPTKTIVTNSNNNNNCICFMKLFI